MAARTQKGGDLGNERGLEQARKVNKKHLELLLKEGSQGFRRK